MEAGRQYVRHVWLSIVDVNSYLIYLAHINNLYNTTFWALVQQGGQTTTEAHATLRVSNYPWLQLDNLLSWSWV